VAPVPARVSAEQAAKPVFRNRAWLVGVGIGVAVIIVALVQYGSSTPETTHDPQAAREVPLEPLAATASVGQTFGDAIPVEARPGRNSTTITVEPGGYQIFRLDGIPVPAATVLVEVEPADLLVVELYDESRRRIAPNTVRQRRRTASVPRYIWVSAPDTGARDSNHERLRAWKASGGQIRLFVAVGVDDQQAARREKRDGKRKNATAVASRSSSSDGRASGTLTVTSTPPCRVYVDGALEGWTPALVTRPAGSHRITLVNEESRIRETFDVDVKANENVRLDKDLTSLPLE